MYFDYSNMMCEDQAATAVDAHVTTNYLDTVAIGNAIDELRVFCQVTRTCTSGGSATVTFALETDDNTSFGSPTTLITSGAVAVASCAAGFNPWGAGTRLPSTAERYIRGKVTIGTATLTAGAWTIALTPSLQNNTL
jgi:hypothetical protein